MTLLVSSPLAVAIVNSVKDFGAVYWLKPCVIRILSTKLVSLPICASQSTAYSTLSDNRSYDDVLLGEVVLRHPASDRIWILCLSHSYHLPIHTVCEQTMVNCHVTLPCGDGKGCDHYNTKHYSCFL